MRHKFNFDYFEKIDTAEKAYWFGFLMADGCIYKGDSKNSFRLQINLKGSDIEHLEEFQEAIESNYKIQEKVVRGSNAALLKVNSTKMCRDLMEHGLLPRKSQYCEFPNIDDNLLPHFIRGYFDGDGSISKSKQSERSRAHRLSICGHPMFLEKLKAILENKGFFFTYENIGRSVADALVLGREKEVAAFGEWIYKDSTIHLSRKKKIYENFIDSLCPLEQ